MERTHFGQHENCGPCRWQTVAIAPSAMPTRHNDIPPRTPNNSWEKGVAVHKPSGMPYLDEHLDTIPIHEWQHKRSQYEREFNAQTTAPAPVP